MLPTTIVQKLQTGRKDLYRKYDNISVCYPLSSVFCLLSCVCCLSSPVCRLFTTAGKSVNNLFNDNTIFRELGAVCAYRPIWPLHQETGFSRRGTTVFYLIFIDIFIHCVPVRLYILSFCPHCIHFVPIMLYIISRFSQFAHFSYFPGAVAKQSVFVLRPNHGRYWSV
jgi:hypothetical protein